MIIIGVMPDTQCVSGIPSGVIMVVTSLFFMFVCIILINPVDDPPATYSGGTV